MATAAASNSAPQTYNVLTLTESECNHLDSLLPRVQRFSNQTGGCQGAIIFLASSDESLNHYQIFQDLQYFLITNNVDLTVLYANHDACIPKIVNALSNPPLNEKGRAPPVPLASTQILPYCSLNPPISKQALTALTDIASSMRGIARLQTDPNAFDKLVAAGVSKSEAEACVEFWRGEYLPDC